MPLHTQKSVFHFDSQIAEPCFFQAWVAASKKAALPLVLVPYGRSVTLFGCVEVVGAVHAGSRINRSYPMTLDDPSILSSGRDDSGPVQLPRNKKSSFRGSWALMFQASSAARVWSVIQTGTGPIVFFLLHHKCPWASLCIPWPMVAALELRQITARNLAFDGQLKE